jgi:hypothetical protein
LGRGYAHGVAVLTACIGEIAMLQRDERKAHLSNKVRACSSGITTKGYLKLNFVIGIAPGPQLAGVCRDAFCMAYGIGHSYLDKICVAIKQRVVSSSEPALNDSTPSIGTAFIKNLIAMAESFKIELSVDQLGALLVPNTVASLSCFAWMRSFFESVGDKQPTGGKFEGGEIHLEPTSILQVHSEYVLNIEDAGEVSLSYAAFLSMWRHCFPHVKIREYKAVSGKCKTCTLLSEARRKHLSRDARRYLTQLHALHRTMYMGERMDYYARRNDAMMMPSEYWSGIGDGMMQSHCSLPYRGNMIPFPTTLPQHLQGILAHGRSVQIYRTFHNVQNGVNLSVHCLFLALEREKHLRGRIPDILYYQIDGGSENTGQKVIALAELIVARGLVKKVVLTRLPVGHTHEDIDSKFALIWKRVRSQFVLSPIQYAELIDKALTTDKLSCHVIDIFVIPDYVGFIAPFMDQNFGR